MKRYKRVLSAVHMVYRLVNSTYNVRELSLRLTRLLCQFIHASSSSVFILDSAHKKIALIASFNNKINMIQEKKIEVNSLSKAEREVSRGASIFAKRFFGLPLVAEENIGAIFIRRKKSEPAFNEFDREMLTVFAEQTVTAVKNLQLYEQQQKIILGSIKFLGNIIEQQGPGATRHASAYSKIMKSVGEKLKMNQDHIESLEYAGLLHDTGAIDVPYEILSKTSRLTPEEFKIIRNHPAHCVELIKPVEFLRPVLPIILYHHEKFDGTGYPSGLHKEQIPLGARVMAVVDAFEAMISTRAYRKTMSIEAALQELRRNSGTQFDPLVISAFCELSAQKKFRKYLSLIQR